MIMAMHIKTRCGWVKMTNQAYVDYHDNEWGRPLHDDHALFELLCLEGAQAGLSWETILNRREEYRKMFWNFNVSKIVRTADEMLLERMQKYGVIKNRLKIIGVKKNAIAYNQIVRDHGSLDVYLWSFVHGASVVNAWQKYADAPTQNDISIAMSKGLKKYGFSFIGPTICYAFMQAAGLVSDHEKGCFLA